MSIMILLSLRSAITGTYDVEWVYSIVMYVVGCNLKA